MRFITNIKNEDSDIKRLMIHDCQDGVYLFKYDISFDGSAIADYWFENLDDAFDSCNEDYNIERGDWVIISDPLKYCQQDWINPVRVVGRENNNPQWGRLENLLDGKWIEV